jgi:hypothetical protein
MVAVTAVFGLSQVAPEAVKYADTYRVVLAVILETVAVEIVPPESYHLNVLPAVLVADNGTLEYLQPTLETVVKIDGVVTTVAITGVLVADVPLQLVASA